MVVEKGVVRTPSSLYNLLHHHVRQQKGDNVTTEKAPKNVMHIDVERAAVRRYVNDVIHADDDIQRELALAFIEGIVFAYAAMVTNGDGDQYNTRKQLADYIIFTARDES